MLSMRGRSRARTAIIAGAVVAAVALGGCTGQTGTTTPAASTPAAPSTPGDAPGEEAAQVDEFSPLIVSMVAGDPVPVRGTDGLYHLVYEIEVQNASPRPASIRSIVSSADGEVVGEMDAAQIVGVTLPIGDYPFPPEAVSQIPAATSAVILMDTTFERREDVPAALVHTIEAEFGDVRPGQANFAELFPTEAAVTATTTVGTGDPIVVAPPLAGPDWVAVNACCGLSPHRGAIIPVGGRINAAERYAIDWSRFDLERPPVDNGVQSTFAGDPGDNASYFTFDQPVLAVADGTVVTVVDDMPDAEPGVLQSGLPLADYGGNHIVLEIDEGVYAFYAHLKQGSVEVEVGDTVSLGDEIARTGNSGNTTESHLHFHIMDAPAPLSATNLPFEISAFTMLGSASGDGTGFIRAAGERTDELPLGFSAISFPEER